ncbi:MAG: hypothetical protein ACLU3N_05510 [Lachnospiraceae bacterium]
MRYAAGGRKFAHCSTTVPDATKKAMYSFWYSMHQNVTAKNVEESRRAAQLGLSAVIVDDGWQTEDNNRGYAYCGDWEPSGQKFLTLPDMLQMYRRWV